MKAQQILILVAAICYNQSSHGGVGDERGSTLARIYHKGAESRDETCPNFLGEWKGPCTVKHNGGISSYNREFRAQQIGCHFFVLDGESIQVPSVKSVISQDKIFHEENKEVYAWNESRDKIVISHFELSRHLDSIDFKGDAKGEGFYSLEGNRLVHKVRVDGTIRDSSGYVFVEKYEKECEFVR